jgi:hypothetical protein
MAWSKCNKGNHGEQRASVEQFQFNVRWHTEEWKQYLQKGKKKHEDALAQKWSPRG